MIEAQQLVKYYGAFPAVGGVSFRVARGEVLGFLGPNGAGKSTTMKMLTGFLPATSGTAKIMGVPVVPGQTAASEHFGYLPERGPLYADMAVGEFLEFTADLRLLKGSARGAALARVREACHLAPVWRQSIETLSKGFRQRVGLAQAILHDPPCLILDEPTDGLDPIQKREVRALIRQMARDKAIILSTHILEEAKAICDRAIIIAQGRIVADESMESLLARDPDLEETFARLTMPAEAVEATAG